MRSLVFVMMVIAVVGSRASAQTVPIRVDGTALTSGTLSIDGGHTAQFSSRTVATINLTPGVHSFNAPPPNGFNFTVTTAGTVDYDASLDAFVSGRGTSTLTVTGFAIAIDAHALSVDSWVIDGGHTASGTPSVPSTIHLIPGSYGFGAPVTNAFAFTVTNAGTIDFATSLDGFVAGRGTSTLTVNGFTVTIDATALAVDIVRVDGGHDGQGPSSTPLVLHLVPGSYGVGVPVTNSFTVTIAADGTFDYISPVDGFVTGRGTTTLRVIGYPITFDATALSSDVVRVDGGHDGQFPRPTVTTLRLVPGLYGVSAPGSFAIQVTTAGSVDYSASFDGFVSGRGTSELVISGFAMTIDATALAAGTVALDGTHDGSHTSTSIGGFALVPGSYGLTAPGGISLTVTVTASGTWDYAANINACITGRGTSQLELHCNPALCTPPSVTSDPIPTLTAASTLAVTGAVGPGVCSATGHWLVTDATGTHTFAASIAANGAVSGTVTLAEGTSSIVLTVVDASGNTASSAARTITRDSTAPVVTVLSPADGSTVSSETISLAFSLADQTATTVTVDDQTFSFPTGSTSAQLVTLAVAGQGSHTIAIAATDAVGNTSSTSVTVFVDATAPVVGIDVVDGAIVGAQPGDVLAFTLDVDAVGATTIASSAGTFALPRGGGVWQSTVPLTEGVNVLSFAVTDEAGHTSTLTRTVTYDRTPPQVTFASAGIARGSAQLAVDATDATSGVASIVFLVDGTIMLVGNPATLDTTVLADGAHTIEAIVADRAGNTTTAGATLVVDNTPPVVAISGPADGSYVGGTIALAASASDATSGVAAVAIAVGGIEVARCTGTTCSATFDTHTLGTDGGFVVTATALDAAGNEAAPAQRTLIADNSAPASFLVSPTTAQRVTTSMTVQVAVVDADFASVECRVAGASLGVSTDAGFTRTVDTTGQLDGALDVTCSAADRAGNVGTQTATPVVANWTETFVPSTLELKSKGKLVKIVVHNANRAFDNTGLLRGVATTLNAQLPGGVPAVAATALLPSGVRDGDDDGDDRVDGDDAGRVVVELPRAAFIASLQAAIATHAVDPHGLVTVTLRNGNHAIGTATFRVR